MTDKRRRLGDLEPDPEMWAALGGDEGLRAVLEDFYTRVFADPQLSPFFVHTNQPWVQEKQFSFLKQVFTGEATYFGDRPRNAHHWMVISDALFDHRERLMEVCLRRFGLREDLVRRWLSVEEIFRKQIVKDKPIPRKLRGEALPLEGYGTVLLEVGTLCDGCTEPVEAGESVRYHLRTGRSYCDECMPVGAAEPLRARAPL